MSDTPKTDAKAIFFGWNPDEGEEFVQADFARELERENVALRQERDSYRFRSEQIWGLRKEIQAALGVPADCEGEEALKRGLESIEALRADNERLDWLAVSDEWFDVPATGSFTPDTFRAAIDAAR